MTRLRTYIAVVIALAFPAAAMATQALENSPHDLTTARQSETCVFCHTPYNNHADAGPPLWNQQAAGIVLATFDSRETNGAIVTVGSASIACLTCHDGAQGMDAAIPPTIADTPHANALRHNHPVSVAYAGYSKGFPEFPRPDYAGAENGLRRATIFDAPRWWIDTEPTPNGVRNKTDLILFTRTVNGEARPFVECATCHDPHGEGDAAASLMRIDNGQSAVCLTCHTQ